jgi:heme/copper-type cytochrome/quinol oxidase subunit 4
MISMHWYDWAGLLGVALTLIAFYLLQAGRLRGDGLSYQLMNAFGAFAVLLSLLYAFNLSAFVLEGLWLGISIYGIVRGRRLRRSR